MSTRDPCPSHTFISPMSLPKLYPLPQPHSQKKIPPRLRVRKIPIAPNCQLKRRFSWMLRSSVSTDPSTPPAFDANTTLTLLL